MRAAGLTVIDTGLRMRLGIVAETGDAWDIHHFATLIGYGCEVVHPWLALQSVAALFEPEKEDGRGRRSGAGAPRPGPAEAKAMFRACTEKGLLKVMSKMGIAVLHSYCGAQIFECLGLGHEVIQRCFRGTESQIGGVGFGPLARRQERNGRCDQPLVMRAERRGTG